MSEQDELRVREQRLKQLILTLEWDKSHQQIHAGHDKRLKEYKKELEDIEKQLDE